MQKKLYLILFFVFFGGIFFSFPSEAQKITRLERLGFGSFVIKNNTAQHDLVVNKNNNVTADSAYIIIEPPIRGRYVLSEFTPDTTITLTLTDATLTLNNSGTGEAFTVIPDQYSATLTTSSDGTLLVRAGATLRSSGSGVMYADGQYSGDINIVVNY